MNPARPCPWLLLLLVACAQAGAVAVGTPAAGDEQPARRECDAFLPAGYQGEMLADYGALRRTGLLDTIERLPMMASYLEQLANGYGCELDDLQRVRTALVFDPEGTGRSMRMVSVAECAAGAAPLPAEGPWQPYEQGGFAGQVRRGGAYEQVVLRPRPGLVVEGERALVEPLLTGARPAGGPHPDLAAFLRGDGVLLQFAAGTFGLPAHKLTGTIGFLGYDDPQDPCEFLRVRLVADAEEQLALSVTLRYRPGSANLRRTETDLRDAIQKGIETPEFAALAPLLREIVVTHGATDLDVRWDLGTPAAAVRKLERAALALVAAGNARMEQRASGRR